MKLKLICCIGFCLSLTVSVKAQNDYFKLNQVTSPSPTTASLGKFGEIPVGLHTGIPNISIPLYEIKDGPITVPISLSYHSGGLKVEELASSVGIGWALNAGGMISRQQRGMTDEYGSWVTSATNTINYIIQNGTQGQNYQMQADIETHSRDGEPDIYSYNANGLSGKFFFKQNGETVLYPAKNISIRPLYESFNGDGWVMITEEGIKYEFDKIETVTTSTCTGGDKETKTAWYLSKITSADGKRFVGFTYEIAQYRAAMFVGQTRYISLNGNTDCIPTDPSPCGGTNVYSTPRLKQINFSGGYVKFNYNTIRADIDNVVGSDRCLDQIEVYTTKNVLLKKYDLAFSYFGPTVSMNADPDSRRLRLDSITEKSAGSAKPPYIFKYEESIQFPHRLSLATDHWGYYNGQSNSTHLPSYEFEHPYLLNRKITFPGANKEANPATVQAGILKNIKYPTGGETEFTYESNTAPDTRVAVPTYSEYYNYSLNQTYTSLNSPYHTTTFTIPSQGANVEFNISGITASNAYCNYEVNLHCYLIKDNDTTNPFLELTDNDNAVRLTLPGGTYKFRFTFDGCNTGSLEFAIYLHNRIPIVSEMGRRPVGGVRIKKMEDRPGGGGKAVVKKYRYESETDSTRSSGTLVNFPEYGYIYTVHKYMGGQSPAQPCILEKTCIYLVQSAHSHYPLATSQGSYVAYSNVVEDLEENGEIRHSFFVYVLPTQSFPFPPLDYSEWQLGTETRTKYYGRQNNQLFLAKENLYTHMAVSQPTVTAYMVGRQEINSGTCATSTLGAPLTNYFLYPQFWAPSSTTERLYDPQDESKFTENVVLYDYGSSHFQLNKTITFTTKSDASVMNELVTLKKYPQDYVFSGSASGSAAQGIKKLQDLHVVNVPVEEYSYRRRRNISTNAISDERVVGGMITTFRSDNPYPDKLYRLETNTPIALSTYGTGSGLSSNSFIRNSNSTIANAYIPAIEFNSYDAKGNLTQQQKSNDVYHSYLWGYDTTLAVAEVINATSNEIFFESFEQSGTWDSPATLDSSRSHTGRFSVRITNTGSGESTAHSTKWLTISSGVARKFRYSGWVYSNGPSVEIFLFMKRNGETGYYSYVDAVLTNTTNKWVYVEKDFEVPSDVTQLNIRIDNNGSGTVWFDDIRLHPTNAMMTTYTYAPLTGVTSVSDVNSKPTYYEYDLFNRLTIVRDDQGNIVKRICYNYAGQAEDCDTYYTNVSKSGSFTRNNCASGATAGTVTYTVAAGTYSSTISQADADAKAQNDVNANGQAYANANAVCTWYSVAKSGSFTRNNCSSGATGGTVTYNVSAGAYSSTISQADADSKAQNDVNTNGQSYANANAACTWYSVAKSGNFTRNNCASGGTGGTITYNVSASAYTSTISQADADSKAQNDVNTNGQGYANTNASCTWYSAAVGANYYKSNCGSGYIAQAYYVSISAGTYSSTVSQAAANTLATNAAQAQADANGTCVLSNVLMTYNNSASGSCYRVDLYNTGTNTHYYYDVTYTGAGYLGYVPPGTYHVTIDQPYGMCDYTDRVFEVGCGNSTNTTSPAYFYYVTISSSCNSVTIY